MPPEPDSPDTRPTRTALGVFALTVFVVSAFALRNGLTAAAHRDPLFWLVSGGFALQLGASAIYMLRMSRRAAEMRPTGEPARG